MRKSSRAAGRQCAPLHPPPRSASASYLLDFEIILAKLYYFFFIFLKKLGIFHLLRHCSELTEVCILFI